MISDYMNHSIVAHPRTATGPDGSLTFGTSFPDRVFFRRKQRRLTDANGNTIVSDGFFLAKPARTYNEGDKVLYRGSTYEVLAVDHLDDPDEDVYQRVSLQRKS